ncbi:hypothetical protein GCM10023093_11550 [Nemorincola caseinilytica]|uniref:Carboxypeptidase regulatory-like domain-containing protein n=1 Tax=Nemorincola caseinilytica TaxID=2054315 RepID=A0ABP8N974_9BACT
MTRPKYIQIDIPEACEQDWDQMTPCANGRYCDLCSKTVIDFTTWSDDALYEFFSKQKGAVCGRYHISQLGRPIHIPPQPHSRLYRMVVAMGLTLIFSQGTDVYAQSKAPTTHQTAIARQKNNDTYVGIGQIVGTIMDEKNQPMAGAVVMVIKGGVTKGGAATDFDGNYMVRPLDPGIYTVEVQYAGYAKWSKEVTVRTDTVTVIAMLQLMNTPASNIRLGGPMKPLINMEKSTRRPGATDEIPGPAAHPMPVSDQQKEIDRLKGNEPGRRTYTRDEIKNMPIR